MSTIKWMAVDWGTSNLRVWAMNSYNQVIAKRQSSQGMSVLNGKEFEKTLISLIDDWLSYDKIPIIACGMVGARQGWIETPYRSVPSSSLLSLQRVSTQDTRIEVFIIGGLRQDCPADVMRGEETQIAGFLAKNPEFSGAICLPGTHSKWVQIKSGKIIRFQTMMTGELFHLLSHNSVLRFDLGDWNESTFLQVVTDSEKEDSDAISQLFSIRAQALLYGKNDGCAMLSGQLIGAELKAVRSYWYHQKVVIIGDQSLAKHYQCALKSLGASTHMTNSVTMTLNGLTQAYIEKYQCEEIL